MTDEMTTGPGPYPVPALAVRATYPASDGRVPEEIVIEFGGDGPVDPVLVDRAVDALARVAAHRDPNYTFTYHQPADSARTGAHTVAAAGAPLVDRDALAADVARREGVSA